MIQGAAQDVIAGLCGVSRGSFVLLEEITSDPPNAERQTPNAFGRRLWKVCDLVDGKTKIEYSKRVYAEAKRR